MVVVVVMVVMMMVVVTMIPAMVMVVVIPAMVMVVVVVMVPILRQSHVRVLLGLRLGARYVYRIGGDQQSNRIRDWLEQLRIRPGVQDFSYFPRLHRFHRVHRCKGGDCAHKTCDLLVHVDLAGKIHASAQIHARSQLAH